MLDLGRYGVREILKMLIFHGNVKDFKSATPLMNFDYANTASEESTADRVYAMGAGIRRMAFDGNKEKTLVVETQIFTMQHLALMTGESIKQGKKDIYRVDTVTVEDGGVVTLAKTPINGDVAVLPYVNGMTKRLPQTVSNVNGDVVTLDLTVANAVEVGDEVEVYYQWNVADSYSLAFTDESSPPYVTIVGNTLYSDEELGESIPAQIIYYRAKLRQEATFSYSSEGDPTTMTLTFDLFPRKINGKNTTHEIILYDDPSVSPYVDVVYADSNAVSGQ